VRQVARASSFTGPIDAHYTGTTPHAALVEDPEVMTHQAAAADPIVVDLLLKTLERSEEPLTASQLQKGLTGPYRRRTDLIEKLLEELVEHGRIHPFPPSRGKRRYWSRDFDQYSRSRLLKLLEKRSSTRTELRNGLKTVLKGRPSGMFKQLLDELMADGQAHKLPSFVGSRTERFSARTADPQDYLRAALKSIYEKLEKEGVSRAQVDEAALQMMQPAAPVGPSPEEIERLIVDGMIRIEPKAASGALVSIRDLRRAMRDQVPAQHDFDRVVLRLADQGRVALHRHDYPGGVSAEERAGMIPDGQGSYYIGVALRV
jgi:hypothetical protein